MIGPSQSLSAPAALAVDNMHQQKRLWLSKLMVDNFRNYQQAQLQLDAPAVGVNRAERGWQNQLTGSNIIISTGAWHAAGPA